MELVHGCNGCRFARVEGGWPRCTAGGRVGDVNQFGGAIDPLCPLRAGDVAGVALSGLGMRAVREARAAAVGRRRVGRRPGQSESWAISL